jgi:sulfur carrier protein ThiS adenylyltransferase
VAYSLTRIGVGHLHLIDFDVVDVTNLNRQQYFMEHVGMYKTEALKSLLMKINPYIEIKTDCVRVTEENIKELFCDNDIVCEAFDNPDAKALLVNGIMEYFPEKKLVSASGMAGFGSSNSIVTRRITKNFYLCGDRVTAPSYGNGLMAPRVAVCAAHEANMITRLILGEEEV